jgi:NAD-dependent deacetylase sirtuin 2
MPPSAIPQAQRDDLVSRMSGHLAAVGFHVFEETVSDTTAQMVASRVEEAAFAEATASDASDEAGLIRIYTARAGELLRAEAKKLGVPSRWGSGGDAGVTATEAELTSSGMPGGDEPASGGESETSSDEEELSALQRLVQKLALRKAEQEEGGEGEPSGEAEEDLEPLLSSFDVAGVAEYIKSGKCGNIIFMAGAGISVSAGIPDFRTPGTGLYDNLQKYDLPHPTAVFELDYFQENPAPFYLLAKELYPGQYPPTPTHHFVRLLHEKGLLLRCFTQNIDSLEAAAGLPHERIVAAHGNFDSARCLKGHPADVHRVREHVDRGEVMRCESCDGCDALVKPDIVFFGENLPERFARLVAEDFPKCDLLIVAGTSLAVHPFAGLINHPGEDVPRMLVNREKVGEMDESTRAIAKLIGRGTGFDFGETNRRDALHLGDCDAGFEELARLLGWEDELKALVEKGRAQTPVKERPS